MFVATNMRETSGYAAAAIMSFGHGAPETGHGFRGNPLSKSLNGQENLKYSRRILEMV